MTDPTSQILVGIDHTPRHEALSLGSALAVMTGSTLALGAVYGHQSGNFGGMTWPPQDDAAKWLRQAEQQIDGQGFAWRSLTMAAASAAEGLIALAELESVELIVLGSGHHGPIGRVFAGSTVRRVVHGAPCAVAVAPHGWRPLAPDAPIAIGVALADTPESRAALATAAGLAAATGSPLRALTAVHVPSPAHPMFASTGTSHATWVAERVRDAEVAAREALAAVAPDAQAEIVVTEGDPVERLADASRHLDLLVLGSRRYGPLRTTLLGGVSSPLIERAACPLVIVPRGVDGAGARTGSSHAAARDHTVVA